MTVAVVLASLVPILRETGIGSDVMKPIAAPIVGGMITSTIHVLILVPVFFAIIKGAAPSDQGAARSLIGWQSAGRRLRRWIAHAPAQSCTLYPGSMNQPTLCASLWART